MNLKIDPAREPFFRETGIYVRALNAGKWDSVDINALDRESLWHWLTKGNDRDPLFCARTVMLLLGHEIPPPL